MTEIMQGNLILKDQVVYGQIVIEASKISDVITGQDLFLKPHYVAAKDQYIAPGFVDIQINGAFGKEFKTNVDSIDVVSSGLPKFGTTSFCPTVTTKAISEYPSHLGSLMAHAKNHNGASWLGFHLEGPYLNPKKVGAQNADLLEIPTNCDYESYLSDKVKIITLSPELDGADNLINEAIKRGIKIGYGHTLASYDEVVNLENTKDVMIVHVYNAMADLNSRKPGVLGVALDRSEYYCSVIADGIHVSEPSLRILWNAKQDKSKIICITDGSAVAGMDIGIHKIGIRSIEKREDRAVLEGTETLVGSTLTQNIAIKNMIEITGCSIPEAVNCVSLNPASYLGVEENIGQIKVGLSADIVVLSNNFDVMRTMIGGNIVWEL